MRVTRGCPWNHCTFCGMYKNKRYEARPYTEIKADIEQIQNVFPTTRTLFIGDSDSLLHNDILKILKEVKKKLSRKQAISLLMESKKKGLI